MKKAYNKRNTCASASEEQLMERTEDDVFGPQIHHIQWWGGGLPERSWKEEYQKGLRKILICTFLQSKFASKEMAAFVIEKNLFTSPLILSSFLAAAKASAFVIICV